MNTSEKISIAVLHNWVTVEEKRIKDGGNHFVQIQVKVGGNYIRVIVQPPFNNEANQKYLGFTHTSDVEKAVSIYNEL